MTTQEIIDKLMATITEAGIDPDECVGCVWLNNRMIENPALTVDELIEEIRTKINAGEADHGWYYLGLRYSWNDLTEAQRMREMEILAEKGAHKPLCRGDYFVLTDSEKTKMIALLDASGSTKAADELRSRSSG